MIAFNKCLYYLVRAMGEHDLPEEDCYFEDALKHVAESGLPHREIEIDALVSAAKRRGRLEELDAIVGGLPGD